MASAIGVGSIWKFPYEVGANGGGMFVVAYLAGLALVVVPLMLAEFALGRRGRSDAAASIRTVATGEHRSPKWAAVGYLGAAAAFLILSYYSVIGGWTVYYATQTAVTGLPGDDSAAVDAQFASMLSSPWRMAATHALFLAAVASIVARGVQRGIEAAMKVLMPLLAALLVALAVYALVAGDHRAALRFLFVPDLENFNAGAALSALGLGFFSIGVGLGTMITYAAYSPDQVDLKSVAVGSVIADTAVSIVAGLCVFPIVFAHDLDPAGGPGLVFVSLPLAFASMPASRFAATAFFVLLLIAAVGSATSLLESVVAVVQRLFGWSRRRSVAVSALSCFTMGLATVLSFNAWAHVRPLGWWDRYREATPFDVLDEFTSNLMLPLGGLSVAIFCGWVVSRRLLSRELQLGPRLTTGHRLMLRYIAPAAIVAAAAAAFVA